MLKPFPIITTQHYFVPKQWGWESWIINNNKYCGKILFIKKGYGCSWHYHIKKEETLYLQSGKLRILFSWENGFELYPKDDFLNRTGYRWKSQILGSLHDFSLLKGESIEVKQELNHAFYALRDSYLIEFSTEHKEEDSIRLIKGEDLWKNLQYL